MPTIGSQALLRVLPRTHYDFRALKKGTVVVPLAQRIDVLGYDRVTLQVRVHGGEFPKHSALVFRFADDGFTPDDPGSSFLQTKTASGDDIGSLRVGDGVTLPFYQAMSVAIGGRIGRMLAITMSATGEADGAPAALISLDLVLSGGHVGTNIHQPSSYLGYALETTERIEAFEQLAPAASAIADPGIERIAAAIAQALKPRRPNPYPRFNNVNVGLAPGAQRADDGGGYPRFSNVNVAMNVEGEGEGEGEGED
jgi:hypothetical protein